MLQRVAHARTAPPVVPETFVDRPTLRMALDEGEHRPLTLVCAPPGYGKSLLLADWVAREDGGARTAWVTLDEDDADPRRLWSAVLAALVACPAVPASSRLHRLIVSRTSVEVDFVADLLDALDALPERIRLVLDDVHHLSTPESLHGLDVLVQDPRPRVRLVLASRAEPPLPLARMRLEERLCELRERRLRFSVEETAALLRRHGTPLPAEDAAVLHVRTGGWVAGLRLAALQLRDRPDAHRFVTAFSGDDRPVADYLFGEVVLGLDADDHDLLRRVSICNPVPAQLAVQLSGRANAADMLRAIEHDTALVEAVGPHHREFRVQEMLRSYLLADLGRSGLDLVADLHRRAAQWWSGAGHPVEALEHARRAGDDQVLRGLLHHWGVELAARGEHRALLDALWATADRPIAAHPWLSLTSAQVHLARGDRAGVATLLRAARPSADLGDVELDRLRTATAQLAWLDEDSPEDGPDDRMMHDGAPGNPALGVLVETGRAAAALAAGATGVATATARAALDSARRCGFGLLELQCLCVLSAAAWLAGDHRTASRTASRAAESGQRHGWGSMAWSAGARAVQAHAALVRARPRQALQAAVSGLESAPDGLEPAVRFALRTARGAALADTGERTVGLRELQEARAELGAAAVPGPLATAAALLEHRTAVLCGHPAAATAAAGWLTARGTGRAERSLMRAWADPDAAGLTSLLPDEEAVLATTAVEAALLATKAALRAGDRSAARQALHEALARAEPQDALRPFTLAGRQVRALLVDQLGAARGSRAFAVRALEAGRPAAPARLVLSAREQDVLRELPTLRNLDEIAAELSVSINTVKSHVRTIYGKLGVSSRRAAVLAADERGLLV